MEYMIVTESDDNKLVERVNNYIKKGWKLHGQPYTKNHLTTQAMVKGEYPRPSRVKGKKNESD